MNRLKSGLLVLGIVSLLLTSSSCFVSKAEGQLMASDIDRLKNAVATLQREQSDQEILQQKKHGEIDSRLDALENVTFKKAFSEGSDNDRLKKELEDLRGQLEETQKDIQTIKPASPVTAPKEEAPEDKKEHFEWAKQAFSDENYGAAYSRADSFIEKYKADKTYGADIYMLKADAAAELAKAAPTDAAKADLNKKALAAYQDFLTRFPKSSRTAEGLFKVGETMRTMGFVNDAKIFYQEIVEKQKNSSFAKKAKDRLAEIAKKKKK